MSASRVHYCLGFALNDEGDHVLMLRKNRPDFLVGKWTGVGGHVETGEDPGAAMAREFLEETGVATASAQWIHLEQRANDEWILDVYAARLDITQARTTTEEPVAVLPLTHLPPDAMLGPQVRADIDRARAALGWIPSTTNSPEGGPLPSERSPRRGP